MNIIQLLSQVLPIDSNEIEKARNAISGMTKPIVSHENSLINLWESWRESLINFGIRVVLAIALFFIGRWVIRQVIRLLRGIMLRRKLEGVAVSLINSIVIALLYIVLGIAIAGTLGVQSVSFAAILASMGLAIGMALSGQLQNLAGGVIIVITKPFTIGNYIQAQGVEGTVKSVSLFHSVITTLENKTVYIPNGSLSSGVIVNVNEVTNRRLEWIFGIDYDSNVDQAMNLLIELLQSDTRVLGDPAPFVAIKELGASSVNIVVRAWVHTSNYSAVMYDFNREVFLAFGKAGINFPYPQLTISNR